jgi:hypothetical protein
MTFLRKWRFPILIGSGLIAAGVLVYFSHAFVSTDKTQGAIGKRDVYRDAQVASADVAAPGSAPVAVKAILESSEFKELAKDPAFQQVMNSSDFAQMTQSNAFLGLISNADFIELSKDPEFALFLKSDLFHNTLKGVRDNSIEDKGGKLTEFTAKHFHDTLANLQDHRFDRIVKSKAFDNLSSNLSFLSLAAHQENSQRLSNLLESRDFNHLLGSHNFQAITRSEAFSSLTMQLQQGLFRF